MSIFRENWQIFSENLTFSENFLGKSTTFRENFPRKWKFREKTPICQIFEEVSGLLTESQFEEIYKHATSEPYNALVIDNHPKSERDKRFKKNFDVVLTHGS